MLDGLATGFGEAVAFKSSMALLMPSLFLAVAGLTTYTLLTRLVHSQRRQIGLVLALVATPATLRAQSIPGALPESAKALSQGEWPAYAGTYAA